MPRCVSCGYPIDSTAIYCPKCWTKQKPEAIVVPTHMTGRYVGVNAGQHLLPLLENSSKSLAIVSPYLSAKYARLLVNLAKNRVDVKIITSSEPNLKHQQALSVLRAHRKPRVESPLAITLLLLTLLAIALSILFARIIFGIFGILLGSLVWIFTRRRTSVDLAIPLNLKVASRFTHAKIYIIDNATLVTGSANLTVAGMQYNVEQMDVTTDPHQVSQAIETFRSLWERS